jgi:pimeloyl-ACP methyl ester carboxylesterase
VSEEQSAEGVPDPGLAGAEPEGDQAELPVPVPVSGQASASRPGPRAGVAERLYRGARVVATDPRALGVLRAVPRAAGFLSQANRRTASAEGDDTVIPVRATAGLAAQVLLDEVIIAMFRHPRLLPREQDYGSAASEVTAARDLFADRGWLGDPASYHQAPPHPTDVVRWKRHAGGFGYEHVAYPSRWEPHPGEPGRDRWLSYERNRTAHAWISSASPANDSGSWLVCVHGFGMGHSPLLDLRSFRAPQLRAEGLNVALPVLPLHGPRAAGSIRGEGLMTINLVDSMHGLAQAAWDLRMLIAWLRRTHGARRVGVFGHSLGAYVAALTAELQDDLDCVIAGIPVVDLPDLFRRHSPPEIAQRAEQLGVLGPAAQDVHRVVSPLSMDCRVPFDGRYVFAGLGDRMATFGHARRLWLHWNRPALATYHGGHVGFYWSSTVRRFVDDALKVSGLTSDAA